MLIFIQKVISYLHYFSYESVSTQVEHPDRRYYSLWLRHLFVSQEHDRCYISQTMAIYDALFIIKIFSCTRDGLCSSSHTRSIFSLSNTFSDKLFLESCEASHSAELDLISWPFTPNVALHSGLPLLLASFSWESHSCNYM